MPDPRARTRYEGALMTSFRDADRRRKALAILARTSPNWRAVKRAQRLLRDADRDRRVASLDLWERTWADARRGLSTLGDALRHAADQIGRIEWPTARIPHLFPGDEIRTIAVEREAKETKRSD